MEDAINAAKDAYFKVVSFVKLAIDTAKKVGEAVAKIERLPGLLESLPDQIVDLVKKAIPWFPTSGDQVVELVCAVGSRGQRSF